MIHWHNLARMYDTDNCQLYLPEQVKEVGSGFVFTAKPIIPVMADEEWATEERIKKGVDPYYTVKSGRLFTDYLYRPPFEVRLFGEIPQETGIVPAFWAYSNPDIKIREVDFFEATKKCRKQIYVSLHDSWSPGHKMVFHGKKFGSLPQFDAVIGRVTDEEVYWRINSNEWWFETREFGGVDYCLNLTLAATKNIKKIVRWQIDNVEIEI